MLEMNENGMPDDEFLEDDDTTKDLYLIFETDNEDYALDVAGVIEIIPMPAITFVPHVQPYMKGIINLRGDIVPVISVRKRFGKTEIPYNDLTCIVVIKHGEYTLGLIVDSVSGVMPITPDLIAPPPSARLSHSNMFIKNVGKTEGGIKLLLDVEKVIFDS